MATGMSGAVIFVMTVASTVTAALEQHPEASGTGIPEDNCIYLVIASFVQLVEIFMKKTLPGLYQALGIYLPLITTKRCAGCGHVERHQVVRNCIGHPQRVRRSRWLVGHHNLRGDTGKVEAVDIPATLDGFPLALISTGLMSLAFLGFSGLFGNLLK